MAGYGCHFWVIFYGEFIPSIKNAIERNKCARTQALLGTYALFYMKLTFFIQVPVDGCHFQVVFDGELIPILKNAIWSKKCAGTQALLGTYELFL